MNCNEFHKNNNNFFQAWTDNPSDPHAFFYKASAVANGSPNYYVTREEDGGILIDPQEPGMSATCYEGRIEKSWRSGFKMGGGREEGKITKKALDNLNSETRIFLIYISDSKY